METKSILCVHQGFELYGSDRSFLQSVRSLRQGFPGARITVILPEHGLLADRMRELADELVIRDMAVLRRSELRKNIFSFLVHLPARIVRAWLDCRNHDLVYINTLVLLDFLLASWVPGRRLFIHVREVPGWLTRICFSLLLAPSRAGLIFNSGFTRKAFFLPKWIHSCVIHNAAQDLHFICPVDRVERELHILHLGRFNAMKGHALLLEAVAGLSAQQRRGLRIRMVGSVFRDQRHHEENIRRQIREYGLEAVAQILDFSTCPEKQLEWAHVVVIPSTRPESFGRTAIEAMSAGRCVIAANHGGLREIVTPDVDGLLFKANDVQDLRESLRKLLDDEDMVSCLGRRGRIKYSRHFTEQNYERKFMHFMLSGHPS